jgi:hypothetical protein
MDNTEEVRCIEEEDITGCNTFGEEGTTEEGGATAEHLRISDTVRKMIGAGFETSPEAPPAWDTG